MRSAGFPPRSPIWVQPESPAKVAKKVKKDLATTAGVEVCHDEAMGHCVLLVENDAMLSDLTRQDLEQAGLRCQSAVDATTGLAWLAEHSADLVLLDLGLPDRRNLDALHDFRRATSAPIVVITARLHGEDKVIALESGADDYVTKPFWSRELIARVRAVLRRGPPSKQSRQRVGPIEIDRTGREVRVEGSLCSLTRTEFDLLAVLVARSGEAIRREQLADQVLRQDDSATEALQTHVSRLRKKLGTAGSRIKTVWGIGYRLEDEDQP